MRVSKERGDGFSNEVKLRIIGGSEEHEMSELLGYEAGSVWFISDFETDDTDISDYVWATAKGHKLKLEYFADEIQDDVWELEFKVSAVDLTMWDFSLETDDYKTIQQGLITLEILKSDFDTDDTEMAIRLFAAFACLQLQDAIEKAN